MFDHSFHDPDDFPEAMAQLGERPLLVFHNDADGLSAGAILQNVLLKQRFGCTIRIIGKGENAYSSDFVRELEALQPTGLIIADLGVSNRVTLPNIPTIIIDHHAPTGVPENATVISGINDDPVPTTSLLAYRCAKAVGAEEGLLWLAALGIIGDMAEDYGFAEMAEARSAYGVTALRKAASLINAPRRTGSGNARPAFDLLMMAQGPKQVLSGEFEETEALLAAKAEVKQALDDARKVGPKFSGNVALVQFSSPCQVHPLIAQQWRGRLKNAIIIAANTGYREGFVHFAVRSSNDTDILQFLAQHRPPNADEQYGNGHRAASGGALRGDDWTFFLNTLGFDAFGAPQPASSEIT
ncbi:DHH family phosphoesterase [Tianweitania sp. BSSL-BM11]|uniref:DHH family phosphoesterase n=1 Tax=Tianweitania aestuarii TaxID=2814886 RepID=A0ABS5RS42_9HYPH|nr:phosphoesterase [Tianweitania aestuarii]MBS9719101.1 DHH family phosphoesterase [Tianweitania aestuarii]